MRSEEGAEQAELYDLGILLQFVRRAMGPNWQPQSLRVAACSPDLVRQVREFSGLYRDFRVICDCLDLGVGRSPLACSASAPPAHARMDPTSLTPLGDISCRVSPALKLL